MAAVWLRDVVMHRARGPQHVLWRSPTLRLVRRVPVSPDVHHRVAFAITVAACGPPHQVPPDSVSPDTTAADSAPAPDAAPRGLALGFHRVPGSRAFDVIATVDWPGGPTGAPAAQLAADRGALGAATTTGLETRARLTPTTTGNYTITATFGDFTVSRTAIVLDQVDEEWDQPEVVRGLVNTAGWEDGPSISPDGTILTLQYLPVAIDCALTMVVGAPACRVRGPIDAPARPRMPGAARVHADGSYDNGCPSIGVPMIASNVVPPDSLYALHRAPDGAFVDPHPILFDGIDGCVSAFGLQLLDAGGDAVYAFDDPRHAGEGARLYRTTLDPTRDRVLGTFSLANGQILLDQAGSSSIGDPGGPIQGNPNEYRIPGGGVVVISDDEQGRRDLFFNTAASEAGPWAGQQLIPPPVSDPGAQESQPFFDGHTLWFRRELVVLATDWNGGPMGSSSSWSTPRTVLAPGTDTGTGTVVVVGEPSVATLAPSRELYFVYGQRVVDGTLDLDIGMVRAR